MKKSLIKKLAIAVPLAFAAADLIELAVTKYKEKQGDYAYFFPEAESELNDVIRWVRETDD